MTSDLEALLQRRAIRVFDGVPVPSKTREQILRAAIAAPSSFNSQPYRLIWSKLRKMVLPAGVGQHFWRGEMGDPDGHSPVESEKACRR